MTAPAATPSSGREWPEPFLVTWVQETGSTNADLLARARQGARAGTVLVADHQTAGRGRLGRTWQAPPGSGLLCSILLRPPARGVPHGAVWAVALAAQQAVAELTGVRPELKWPNDLLAEGRKLAGVLAEAVPAPDGAPRPAAIVVGIGINVGWSTPPADVASTAVTVDELAGHHVARAALLRSLLAALRPLLDLWADPPGALHERYRSRLSTLGRRVRVTLTDRVLEGQAVDVTGEGALVVRDGDRDVVVSAGDVVHLRPG